LNEKTFWQFAADSIKSNHKVVLLTVAESSNSSPGRQGFKMLIRDDRTARGTIGGGIMERNMVDYAFEYITGNKAKSVKRLQHSKKTDLEESGLICGGFQTIIFSLLTESNLQTINDILENIQKRKNGALTLEHYSIKYDKSGIVKDDYEFFYKNNEEYSYKENLGFTDTAYVVGGGHVGLAVSRIMKSIGFYVIVFDHRKEIFTMDENTFADEKIICNYCEVKDYIKDGNKSYVIIVTPAHAGDKDALGAVAKMDLKYIGMMGSKRKIKTIFNNLVNEGVDKKLLSQVHSPIGLEIEAETPEEIAISIAAEIIQIKRTS